MGVDLIREQERREADAALNREMSDMMRAGAGRGTSQPTPSGAPLAIALDAFERAEVGGDSVMIARADAALEAALDAARRRNGPTAPDFAAGARRAQPHEGETFTERLRRERAER